MRLRHRRERLQLRLEERLVDLALVDRHTFLDAHPNHFLPVDAELLRKLIGRQVICHLAASCLRQRKSPLAPNCVGALRRARTSLASLLFAGINGPAPPGPSWFSKDTVRA